MSAKMQICTWNTKNTPIYSGCVVQFLGNRYGYSITPALKAFAMNSMDTWALRSSEMSTIGWSLTLRFWVCQKKISTQIFNFAESADSKSSRHVISAPAGMWSCMDLSVTVPLRFVRFLCVFYPLECEQRLAITNVSKGCGMHHHALGNEELNYRGQTLKVLLTVNCSCTSLSSLSHKNPVSSRLQNPFGFMLHLDAGLSVWASGASTQRLWRCRTFPIAYKGIERLFT